ncbi:MAG: hypothetical protein M1820_006584 [Bogoriella megaspora]|nr:MAG: hypothetical protein M1820_006584 [Bogoriella megaspora]
MHLSTLVSIGALLISTTFAGDTADTEHRVYSQLNRCPDACAGKPDNWTLYSSFDRVQVCNEPVLLDFYLYNSVDGSGTVTKLMTCITGNSTGEESSSIPPYLLSKHSGSCYTNAVAKKATLEFATSGQQGSAKAQAISTALSQVQSFLSGPSQCDTTSIVGYFKSAVVGLYIGSSIDNKATTTEVFQHLTDALVHTNGYGTAYLQLCGDQRNANHTFGVVIDTNGDIDTVQHSLASWSNATCIQNQSTSQLHDISISELPFISKSNATNSTNTASILPRAVSASSGTCKTIKVVAGDGCGTLASECGVSASDFTKFNPQPNLCSSLAVGQQVCCTAGGLPDIKPKPQSDGTCATYIVQNGDTCSAIAANNGLTAGDISKFNDKTTWGWFGCDDLLLGLAICLSTGKPPMPAKVANAVCGPTAPKNDSTGSKITNSDFSTMNPCPLNACCDIWGQCGITPEYCTDETGPKGNPGTAPPNKNGCVSNCGTKIRSDIARLTEFKKIGYYESWNWDRPCLNMMAQDMDDAGYTHAHWGFATISDGFGISINDSYKQWDAFKGLETVKKIVSFGGWGYSTDPATYNVLREAMNPSNAANFATNIVNFLNDNSLDGVDFDWEYPGAPDIPGIPPGLDSDGPNYLSFLKTLRGKMPDGKTISIAAPASYWYLQSFPIKDMALQLDYIVYMTYDLHGQWDAGNQWSQEGCLGGNCLRSHVNVTETKWVLAMITKAGVASSSIVVGVSSYGRSFGMTDAKCTGPMCTYSGSNTESTAQQGRCTGTGGYISNAEILEIIDDPDSSAPINNWFDDDSDSSMMVWNSTWVAYMTDDTKSSRTSLYRDLNFGGTVDWAVDLQKFTDEDGDPDGDSDNDQGPFTDPPPCDQNYATMEDLDAASGSIPDNCKAYYIVSTLNNVLQAALSSYTDMMNNGYDGKFDTYSHAVADSASTQVRDFQNNNGDKYFSCMISELTFCCDKCDASKNECLYCFNGDCTEHCSSVTGHCSKRSTFPELESSWELEAMEKRGIQETPTTGSQPRRQISNQSEPCPPDFSKRMGPEPWQQSVYWTLNADAADNFYADLLENTGIAKDKIDFETYGFEPGCPPSADPGDECFGIGYDYGMATPVGYGAGDVTNPKDLVQKALDNSNNLSGQIAGAMFNLKIGWYYGDTFELVDSLSIPVLMIAQAVDSMGEVESVADKIDEEKRKAIILAFIGAILFFIPIVGEVAGAVAETADIAAIIGVIGTVGNAAFDIYTIVDDPSNAPLAIFSLILAPLALTDLAVITKAATFRRVMKDSDIAALGGKLADRMGTIKKITGTCSVRK